MAQPTLSDVHVNALLTDLSNMYSQEETNFIARDVFPIVPVTKISDRYLTYSRADFNRNQMQKRAPSTLVKNIGYRTDNQPSYLCDVWVDEFVFEVCRWQVHEGFQHLLRVLQRKRQIVVGVDHQNLFSRPINFGPNQFVVIAARTNGCPQIADALLR